MPEIPTMQFPEEELSPDDRDKLIDELARKIVGRGMETPAIMFLEMNKPLAFIASQSMLLASPFLAPIFGMEGVQKYSRLFSSPDNIELLIQRIEDRAEEKARNSNIEARNNRGNA